MYLNSSPHQQSVIVHTNPAQARPTPLKGVPNSYPRLLKEPWFFILPSKNSIYCSCNVSCHLNSKTHFHLLHSWQKHYRIKEGESICGLPVRAYQAMQYPWRCHAERHKQEDPRPTAIQDQAQERRGAQLTPSLGYLGKTCGPQDEDPHRGGKGDHHDHQNQRLTEYLWHSGFTGMVPSRRFSFAFLALWVRPQLFCGR